MMMNSHKIMIYIKWESSRKGTFFQPENIDIFLISASNARAPEKAPFFSQKVLIFFLFLHENIRCGYSLEVSHRGTSNEYP